MQNFFKFFYPPRFIYTSDFTVRFCNAFQNLLTNPLLETRQNKTHNFSLVIGIF